MKYTALLNVLISSVLLPPWWYRFNVYLSVLDILATGWHLTRTPYTNFIGAVYCAFAVNFLIFTKQTYT